MNPSAIREILKLTELPGIISLAGGLPSALTFPVEAVREATTRVLRDTPREALQYAASEGFGPLREWVAAEMARQGLAVSPAQVLITTGSQQGLDLVGKVLIDAGSRVAVESPTYLGALQAFVPYEPEFVGVDGDGDGPLPDALASRAAGARFLYALPNFQNPSGRSISAGRRAQLARAAASAGVPIVEDNPYGDLWYDVAPSAPIASHWREGTIYLGSFSKVLAPGLRLGYVIAPAEVFAKLVQAKQAADLHTPGSTSASSTRSSAPAFSTTTCRRSAAATARSAMRCRRRSSLTCRLRGRSRVAGRCRAAACSSGSSCRRTSTARRCSSRR